MSRFSKIAFICATIIIAATRVSGFSLLGPYATWMDTIKSYQQTPIEIGGPMNIGEDYRWNVPQITYGFDESFLLYFGTNGVHAVEQAIKILNDLPRASDIDLSKYPMNTVRTDFRASSLLLMDVKSYVLSMLLEQLGLAPAERFVWCLREEWHDTAGNPNFIVIKRNFDPETFEPSSYINGALYTYRITHADTPVHIADATKYTVDPTMPAYSTVASQMLSTGQYFTGLTRDDVGGLKYPKYPRLITVK